MKTHRLNLFKKGFRLLRLMAQGPVSRDQACKALKINRRDWYRWLNIFAECSIRLAEDYKPLRVHPWREKTYRLWPQDWKRLMKTPKMPEIVSLEVLMRGTQDRQASMLALITLESRIPSDHPLRRIKRGGGCPNQPAQS